MTDPTFRAKVRPELHPAAAELVRVYNDTYGSCAPGCCPEALAAVLSDIAEEIDDKDGGPCWQGAILARYAALLRGEEP
jgi:hypothetical protein